MSFAQAADKDTKIKTAAQTAGTQPPTDTTDSGALQQWRAIQSADRLELQRLQLRISHIIQDVTNIALAAAGYFPSEDVQRLQSRIDLTNPAFWMPLDEGAAAKQQRTSSQTDDNLNLHSPPASFPDFISLAPKILTRGQTQACSVGQCHSITRRARQTQRFSTGHFCSPGTFDAAAGKGQRTRQRRQRSTRRLRRCHKIAEVQ